MSALDSERRKARYFPPTCSAHPLSEAPRKPHHSRGETVTESQANHSVEHLFEAARTHNAWLDRDVPEELLRQLYNRLRWAPTSANSNPGRFVFVRSRVAKQRLAPHLSPLNAEKTMAAPVCVIVAADTNFYDNLP